MVSTSRAQLPDINLKIIEAQIASSLGWERVLGLTSAMAEATPETIAAILEQSSKYAVHYLEPLNAEMDQKGPYIVEGRVKTTAGHKEAWAAFCEGQWLSVSASEAMGGFGMPTAIWSMIQSVLDRANPAFGMTAVPQISAAKLLNKFGSHELKLVWLPKLISSEWGATICISETDAGSDVRRMKTKAVQGEDGQWTIEGEKNWISFGDQDLTPRIGHCVVAKTHLNGKTGLSLFFVPNKIEEGDTLIDNNVKIRRIEEKMGLHGSPTCALGFEGSKATLLGEAGRGLQQMFVMITNMRICVGAMGLGIAQASRDMAFSYAAERRQGGREETPVLINEHPDVQRMLMQISARVEMFRALILAMANYSDIVTHSTNAEEVQSLQGLLAWLLPIVKTLGADISFETSHDAVQVLGGAGYTKDWPVEQFLRDARVLSVFEGTTGIQALDLVERRLRRIGLPAIQGFTEAFKKALEKSGGDQAIKNVLERFISTSEKVTQMSDDHAHALATPYLSLAGEMSLLWMALHLVSSTSNTPTSNSLKSHARFFIENVSSRLEQYFEACRVSENYLSEFAAISQSF